MPQTAQEIEDNAARVAGGTALTKRILAALEDLDMWKAGGPYLSPIKAQVKSASLGMDACNEARGELAGRFRGMAAILALVPPTPQVIIYRHICDFVPALLHYNSVLGMVARQQTGDTIVTALQSMLDALKVEA